MNMATIEKVNGDCGRELIMVNTRGEKVSVENKGPTYDLI